MVTALAVLVLIWVAEFIIILVCIARASEKNGDRISQPSAKIKR